MRKTKQGGSKPSLMSNYKKSSKKKDSVNSKANIYELQHELRATNQLKSYYKNFLGKSMNKNPSDKIDDNICNI